MFSILATILFSLISIKHYSLDIVTCIQLGSALILGVNVMPLFKQMGIYDEFTELGKYAPQMHIVQDDLKSSYVMDNSCAEKL